MFRTIVCIVFSQVLVSQVSAQLEVTKHIIDHSVSIGMGVYATDIDGDGKVDLTTVSQHGINWWKNDGNGSFARHFVGSFDRAWWVYADDIDGDGNMDLLGGAPSLTTAAWWRNSGNQNFSKQILDTEIDAESIYAADLDGDNDKDILVAGWANQQVVWYENRGSGFTKHIMDFSFPGVHSVHAADFDGDGDTDAVAGGSQETRWYRNNGNAGFTPIKISSSGALSVYTADMDGDGDPDILRTQRNNGDVDWFKNNGTGGFSERTISSGFSISWSVVAGDMNADGAMEVACAGYDEDKIGIWLNSGSGNFSEVVIDHNIDQPRDLFIADLDGDGDRDVAAISRNGGKLIWYEVDFGTGAPRTITVVEPNGGETLLADTGAILAWQSTGSISNVNLEYSLDNGLMWTSIADNVSNDGDYIWLVPDTASAGALVRISDAADAGVFDVSDGNFEIIAASTAPAITSFNPLHGEPGTEVTIMGRNFTETATVAFDGQPALFAFDSQSQIKAIVPENATSGKISVTTLSGTGLSAFNFVVDSAGAESTIVTLLPTDDAQVNALKSTMNYGASASLKVEAGSFRSYLKFAVDSLSGDVLGAKLRLHVQSGSVDGGQVYVVSNDYKDGGLPWQEDGLNFDNAPDFPAAVLAYIGTVNASDTLEIDVSPAISGDGIYSFGIKSNSSDRAEYASKETDSPPQLVLEISGRGEIIERSLTILVTPPGSGIVASDPDREQYQDNEQVTLTTLPTSGFLFDHWTGDLGAADPADSLLTLIMDQDRTVTAHFVPDSVSVVKFKLTVNVVPEGAGNVILAPEKAEYEEGVSVTLTATPAQGYAFDLWAGAIGSADSTDSVLTLVMDQDRTVAANFVVDTVAVQTFTLNVSVLPEEGGTVTILPAKEEYLHGEQVTLIATPSDRYRFVSWSGEADSLNVQLVISIMKDRTLIANFEKDSVTSVNVGSTHPNKRLPDRVALKPNFPNPFNIETTIVYDLPSQGHVRLTVYNVHGRLIRQLVDGIQPPGVMQVTWDGRNQHGRVVASGVYFLNLEAGRFRFSRRITLQK